MNDITEPLHGYAADEVRDQLRAGIPAVVQTVIDTQAAELRTLRAEAVQHRDLLAAIAESLDVPLPSIATRDELVCRGLLSSRASRVVSAARLILAKGHSLDGTAQWIRRGAANTPVTYTPWVQAEEREPEPPAAEPEPVPDTSLKPGQVQLLARIRATGGRWSAGMVHVFYRDGEHRSVQRGTARRDLERLTALGHLTTHGPQDGRYYLLADRGVDRG
ncbi:hypothetical protein [Streptomyces sp. NPDC088554]|uniref:hypothetical protein n=1 Tax=Streptomyces sp. NPDC088554 TaxID=3365865 RepID=UPI003820AA76